MPKSSEANNNKGGGGGENGGGGSGASNKRKELSRQEEKAQTSQLEHQLKSTAHECFRLLHLQGNGRGHANTAGKYTG